jgi:phage protein D
MIDSAALINEQPSKLLGNPNQENRTIEQAQESIYRFLLDIIKLWSAEDVLQEFHCLFIEQPQDKSGNSEPIEAINQLIAWNNEQEFHYTFRRCCYILLNN